MKKTFTAYKKTSTGAIVHWTITADGNTITTEWGQVGGATQRTTETIKEGKNIGRSNETTPEEQALAEAKSRWEKKLKKDYTRNADAAEAGEASELIEGGILPMLAHRFDQHADKIVFPAYVQPKLDGHRCIAVVKGGVCTLWSRTRKPIVSMPHIVEEIERLKLGDCILDGELYNHDYKDKFQELSSLIRPQYAKEGHTVVQYHIYDVADETMPFELRQARLLMALEQAKLPLNRVLTMPVADAEEMMSYFNTFRASGYEGAIIRNAKGMYVNKRSYDLQKVKAFDDSEFKVIGVKEGRGKLEGHGIFNCEVVLGIDFDVKMAGPLENLKQYLAHPEEYIGKQLTVQFQGYTDEGKPRFPVGLRFREDI